MPGNFGSFFFLIRKGILLFQESSQIDRYVCYMHKKYVKINLYHMILFIVENIRFCMLTGA